MLNDIKILRSLKNHIKGYDLLVNKFLYESDRKVGTFFALTAFSFSVVSRKARSHDSFF